MSCGLCSKNNKESCSGCIGGRCNRMNVYNWLEDIPDSDSFKKDSVIEVSFKQGSRKEYFKNTVNLKLQSGDLVTVEGVGGFDVGEVSLTGPLVSFQLRKHSIDPINNELKKILRKSTERDLESYKISKSREPSMQAKSRELATSLKLQMKLSEVEIQADGKKATFFYTADDRVDFRELIKQYAYEFKLKVEMRQIGIRQEAAKVGGIGSCGRELCCSTWLSNFKSVNTTAARYQNLSINQTKLSGQCGRLKCCLNYELDIYLDALKNFPDDADMLETTKGKAILIKKDIFKNLMWYSIEGSTKHYPMTIERVREIRTLNRQGILPEELQAVDLTNEKPKEVELGFVDVVGQTSLKSLEKTDRKGREKGKQGGGGSKNKTLKEIPAGARVDRNKKMQTKSRKATNPILQEKKHSVSEPGKAQEKTGSVRNNPAVDQQTQKSNQPRRNNPNGRAPGKNYGYVRGRNQPAEKKKPENKPPFNSQNNQSN